MSTNYTDLTDNQKKVLEALLGYISANEYPPTIRELMHLSGIKSLRGVSLQLDSLEKAGYLKRREVARGISINRSLIEGDTQKISIPLMLCSIHAGDPTEADDSVDSQISVTTKQTRGVRNAFAVKVSGDSMVGVGINEGDIVILSPQTTAEDGDIVAALVEGCVTLKKYRVVEGLPMLFPANPAYKPISADFAIQGKLLSILK
jgi:repressor LexA